MVVSGDAWKGTPADLEDALTPIQANIQNTSDKPLRVRYNEFELVTASGFRSHAIPPLRIEGSITRTSLAPAYPWHGFYLAPYYRPFYRPSLGYWDGPFFYDPFYYGSYYTIWREPLPSEDMLEKAMPEGVLQAGGRLRGFLYFQKIPKDQKEVTFTASLVDADTEESFGKIAVPFVLR